MKILNLIFLIIATLILGFLGGICLMILGEMFNGMKYKPSYEEFISYQYIGLTIASVSMIIGQYCKQHFNI